MRITIVGAGAVGSLLGGRLAAHGAAVRLIGRPDHVDAIRSHGLTIEGLGPGRWTIEAATSLLPGDVADLLLLTTKTYDLTEAARSAARAFPTPLPTLVPQNGLRVEPLAAEGLTAGGWGDPRRVLVRAVNSVPATLVAPGVVRQAGDGEIVLTDPARAGAAGSATRAFVEVLAASGLRVRVVPDLAPELWRKALVNAAINPVTARHRVLNGRLRESPYRDEAWALLREAQRAAGLAGYGFSDEEADHALETVLRATAGNRSSMLQDVERGRPTEIDAISGELVRVAAAQGVDLPATRAAIQALRPGDSTAAQPS